MKSPSSPGQNLQIPFKRDQKGCTHLRTVARAHTPLPGLGGTDSGDTDSLERGQKPNEKNLYTTIYEQQEDATGPKRM